MQSNNDLLLWPKIKGIPINEFQTSDYMVKTILALYPYSQADLRSERAREIKFAEYFKYLMWYKDGRFARYTR